MKMFIFQASLCMLEQCYAPRKPARLQTVEASSRPEASRSKGSWGSCKLNYNLRTSPISYAFVINGVIFASVQS